MHKITQLGVALILCAGSTLASAADVHVGVSVAGEVAPGVYGRVDIGNAPPPLVYAQPMVIVQPPRPVRPVYMHVPPGHAKNWGKHCHKYQACSQPVYFVKSAEYGYRAGGPSYRADAPHAKHITYDQHEHKQGKHGKHDKHEFKHDKHDKHDKHGRGHGNGRGHGKD